MKIPKPILVASADALCVELSGVLAGRRYLLLTDEQVPAHGAAQNASQINSADQSQIANMGLAEVVDYLFPKRIIDAIAFAGAFFGESSGLILIDKVENP